MTRSSPLGLLLILLGLPFLVADVQTTAESAMPVAAAQPTDDGYILVNYLEGAQAQALEPLPWRAPEVDHVQVAFKLDDGSYVDGLCETVYGKETALALATRLQCWSTGQEQPVVLLDIRYPTPRGTLAAYPAVRDGRLHVRVVTSLTSDVNPRQADWVDTGIEAEAGRTTVVMVPDRSVFPCVAIDSPVSTPTSTLEEQPEP